MTKKASFPQLRFKGFTEAWEQYTLEEIGTIITGSTPPTSVESYYSNDGIPWVTPTDISEHITYKTERMLSQSGQNAARVVPKNTLLVTSIASIGKNTLLGSTGSFNQQINGIIPNSKHEPYFLYSASNHWSNNMKKMGGGLTFQIVNKTEFSQIETLAPKKAEQTKIGSLFRTLDNLITLHQRKYDKLVNVKKSLLQTIFPSDSENTPKVRFQGFTEAWEQYKLGDLGDFKSNGVNKLINKDEKPIYLLNYMDIYNKKIITNDNSNELMKVTANDRQIKENNIEKNDVFFTPTSETADDIANVKVIEESLDNVVYSYHLMRYRPKPNTFYSIFPDYAFETKSMRAQTATLAKGVQRFVLGKSDFESLVVTIPSITEQGKISELFRSLDNLITLHQRKQEKLINVKKSLLNMMFV